jgi:WD40 repeat protein
VASLAGGSFVTGAEDMTIRVSASDGTLVRAVDVRERVASLSLSSCGRFVAAGCWRGFVKLLRILDLEGVWSVKAHGDVVLSVSFGPDGRLLASGSWDETVKLISAGDGATIATLRGHTCEVTSVFFTQDGTKVLSGSAASTVRVWRIFAGDEKRVRGLMGGLQVGEGDWEMREVCWEVATRMKRWWEVEG